MRFRPGSRYAALVFVAGCEGITIGLAGESHAIARTLDAPTRDRVECGRANGLAVLDSSFREPKDPDGFRDACLASRELGFDGKVFEDPALIPVANEAYGPTAEEVTWARRVIAAKPGAKANGEYWVDGQHIDPQYEALAERILRFADAVASRDRVRAVRA